MSRWWAVGDILRSYRTWDWCMLAKLQEIKTAPGHILLEIFTIILEMKKNKH